MLKRCHACGCAFSSKRSTARYCSHSCRQADYKRRKEGISPEQARAVKRAIGDVTLALDDVLEIVTRAHGVAEDLSRAALAVPAPLSRKLERIASALESQLRKEGV